MQKRLPLLVMALLVTAIAAAISVVRPTSVAASDHDDGAPGTKGKARNLTDVIVFEKIAETGNLADDNVVSFIMTVNDRSVARQQYFFDPTVNYDMNVERVAVANNNVPPSQIGGNAGLRDAGDLIFRFRFNAPNTAAGTQTFTLSLLNGLGVAANGGVGDSLAGLQISPQPPGLGLNSANQVNAVTNGTLNSGNGAGNVAGVNVFAGLREDPFFFDVEQYFRVRAGARGLGPVAGFRNAAVARDFPAGYNLLAIVVDAPRALLQSNGGGENQFDFWAAITQ